MNITEDRSNFEYSEFFDPNGWNSLKYHRLYSKLCVRRIQLDLAILFELSDNSTKP